VTTVIKDLKNDEIISNQTYRGEEPFGIWKYRRSNRTDELDYSFDLKYTGNTCKESISGIDPRDYFQDNDSLQYVAPKISNGEKSIFQFISQQTIYPPGARENGTQGTVYLTFKITKEGNIENIVVLRGVDILLDKEAVRVLRQLKLSSPPTFNGEVKEVCATLPITFKLM
jgi:TonB family protein